jgi:hypothetical protein
MRRRRSINRVVLPIAALACLLVAVAPGAGAAGRVGTIRVSVATAGAQGNMMSGRYSRPATTVRVSVGNGGVQSNDASTDPAISGTGYRVAFFSAASNLVQGDTSVCVQFPTPGHCTDIFVRASSPTTPRRA